MSFDPSTINSTIYNLFKDSYTKASPPPTPFNPPHLNKLSSNDTSLLLNPPSDLEIKDIVFSLSPFKALGFDGLNAFFYQKTWPYT